MGQANYSKPQSIGSMYFNWRKDIDKDAEEDIRSAIEFLKSKEVYLALSTKEADGSYKKMSGFFNGYKKKPSDPDIMIRESTVATKTKSEVARKPAFLAKKPSAAIPKTPVVNDEPEFSDEGVPFA